MSLKKALCQGVEQGSKGMRFRQGRTGGGGGVNPLILSCTMNCDSAVLSVSQVIYHHDGKWLSILHYRADASDIRDPCPAHAEFL